MRISPLIIGISGRKRHGKDVVSTILAEHYGAHRLAFADELKRVAMGLWDLSFEQVYGDDKHKETVDERWGISPRVLMQLLGTEVGRNIHKETWVRKAFSIIRKAHAGESVTLPDMTARCFRDFQFSSDQDVWTIPDARFQSEAEAIKANGGIVIKVVRPSIISTDSHASETEVDNVEEDFLIVNDGSLADLEAKVLALAAEILQ